MAIRRNCACVAQLSKQHKIKLTIVLDLIHVIEYQRIGCLRISFSSVVKKLKIGLATVCVVSLKVNQVMLLQGCAVVLPNFALKPEQRTSVDKCANYLLNNRDYLRYDRYLAAGFPIATGVIEGACRYLIKDRMDITGARWSQLECWGCFTSSFSLCQWWLERLLAFSFTTGIPTLSSRFIFFRRSFAQKCNSSELFYKSFIHSYGFLTLTCVFLKEPHPITFCDRHGAIAFILLILVAAPLVDYPHF